MDKLIYNQRNGLWYELVSDYYLIAGDDDPKEEHRSIGIWGQRYLRHIKQHKRIFYANLLTSGKLSDYLADINEEAEEMFSRLVKEIAGREGVTETLKAADQMAWVGTMNNIRNRASEIVSTELIYK